MAEMCACNGLLQLEPELVCLVKWYDHSHQWADQQHKLSTILLASVSK